MFSGAVCRVAWPATWRNVHARVRRAALLFDEKLHKVERRWICNFLVIATRIIVLSWSIRIRSCYWNCEHWQFVFVHWINWWLTAICGDFWDVELILQLLLMSLLSLKYCLQVRHARALTNRRAVCVMMSASIGCIMVVVVNVVIARRISKMNTWTLRSFQEKNQR